MARGFAGLRSFVAAERPVSQLTAAHGARQDQVPCADPRCRATRSDLINQVHSDANNR
jgi:hypothetical protein